MTGEPTDLQAIVESCIVENSSDGWACFLSEFGPLVRRAYHARAAATTFEEFESWFPGWLYYGRKLHSAYRGLQAKIHRGECLTPDEKNQYLSNYVASIVRSGVAEFFRENRKDSCQHVSDSILAEIPGEAASSEETLPDSVLAVLPRLTPELRVPFWLRYFPVMGTLSSEDTAWVVERSGLAAEEVTKLVANEADLNRGRQKPLSSEFIGSLLKILPSADGKFSTVDQRVRRAILRIREHLAESAEEECE